MRVARLDLLREGVDVAEAALERAAGEDRVNPGGLVGVVGDREGVRNRARSGTSIGAALSAGASNSVTASIK